MENLLHFAVIASYSIAVMTEISLNCYFGSQLRSESDGISLAIYASRWMDRNEKCKHAIRILMKRSARPMATYAGGVFELSLPTFVGVSQFEIFSISFSTTIFWIICRFADRPFHTSTYFDRSNRK